MKKILEKLTAGDFESSSGLTPEFKKFALDFKKAFKKELEAAGLKLVDFHRGHFDLSGFYQKGEQLYYFSLSDVRTRFFSNQLMYRTAKHTKDWTGGSNQWVNIEEGMAQNM